MARTASTLAGLAGIVAITAALVAPCAAGAPVQPGGTAAAAASNVGFLVGAWSCRSLDGDAITDDRYVRLPDASLEHRQRGAGTAATTVVETLRHDTAAGRWTLLPAAPTVPALREPYAGPEWTDVRWDLAGTVMVDGVAREAHVVYLRTADDAFERESEIRTDDGLLDAGRVDCRRARKTAAVPPYETAMAHVPSAGAGVSPLAVPLAVPGGASDPVVALLGDAWTCEGTGGVRTRRTYAMRDGFSIAATASRSGAAGEIHELFHWSDAAAAWNVVADDGSFTGSAPAWRDTDWTIDGIGTYEGRTFAVRQRYRFVDGSILRHDVFERLPGEDRTIAREVCVRDALAAPVFPSAQAG